MLITATVLSDAAAAPIHVARLLRAGPLRGLRRVEGVPSSTT